MKMISIYQNKPRLFFQLASVTVCCFIIISLFFLKIPRITSFEGTYSCDSICKITASIPKDFFKEIHSTDTIVIDDELYLLKIVNHSPNPPNYQKIIIEIPPKNFFQNQTINFQILHNNESLLQIFMRAMKGGDAHDN